MFSRPWPSLDEAIRIRVQTCGRFVSVSTCFNRSQFHAELSLPVVCPMSPANWTWTICEHANCLEESSTNFLSQNGKELSQRPLGFFERAHSIQHEIELVFVYVAILHSNAQSTHGSLALRLGFVLLPSHPIPIHLTQYMMQGVSHLSDLSAIFSHHIRAFQSGAASRPCLQQVAGAFAHQMRGRMEKSPTGAPKSKDLGHKLEHDEHAENDMKMT